MTPPSILPGVNVMTSSRARAFATSFAVAIVALLVAVVPTTSADAFSFGKKKPPPPAAAPPPEPEIAVGPPVLASYVIGAASAYAAYMQMAAGITPTFADGVAVTNAVHLGAHSEQHQMQQGMVAYAAIVALQDPTFVATLRGYASHASTRDAMVRYILGDPNYVMTLAGHDTAAGLIVGAMSGQGRRLQTAGEKMQQASLDIQLKAAWSKKAAPNQAAILADIKQLSSSALTPPDDLKVQLAQASTGAQPMTLNRSVAQTPYTQSVVRGMAIAALAVLGKASDADMAYLMPLLVNDGDGFCFNMSKLNLYQCLSVARPHYENMYCLGLHAMADTGRCVRAAVGQAAPFAPPPARLTPTAAPVAAAASPGDQAALATARLPR